MYTVNIFSNTHVNLFLRFDSLEEISDMCTNMCGDMKFHWNEDGLIRQVWVAVNQDDIYILKVSRATNHENKSLCDRSLSIAEKIKLSKLLGKEVA